MQAEKWRSRFVLDGHRGFLFQAGNRAAVDQIHRDHGLRHSSGTNSTRLRHGLVGYRDWWNRRTACRSVRHWRRGQWRGAILPKARRGRGTPMAAIHANVLERVTRQRIRRARMPARISQPRMARGVKTASSRETFRKFVRRAVGKCVDFRTFAGQFVLPCVVIQNIDRPGGAVEGVVLCRIGVDSEEADAAGFRDGVLYGDLA